MSKTFNQLLSIDVNDRTEKKGGLTYLSWSWAWGEFKKACSDATYKVRTFDGKPYFKDTGGVIVFTEVTTGGETLEMWLPVMNHKNKAIQDPDMFEINKTLMRCLTKNIAMFGLGLNIYAGEDLQDTEPEKPLTDLFKTQVDEMTDLDLLVTEGKKNRPENEKDYIRAQYAKVDKANKEVG